MSTRRCLTFVFKPGCLRFTLGTVGVLMLIKASSACGVGYQQENLPPQETGNQSEAAQTPPTPPSPKIDLDALRQNLSEYPDLQVKLNPPNQGVQRVEELPLPQEASQDALTEELEASRQIDEIGSRIRKLMELQKASKLKAPASANPDSDGTNAATSTEPGNLSETTPTTNPAADTNTKSPLDNMQTTRILDTPPDQIALADSLFYTGEIDLAINLYQKVLQATAPGSEDQVWIHYQIASCYRRMNKFDQASKILRKIAEGSDTNPIVVNARWWLDTIERKRKLVNSIDTLEQFIKRKSNEINNE